MSRSSGKTVLITRPEAQAREFARDMEALGFKTLVEPMLELVPQTFTLPDLREYQALIFTSANAVRLFRAAEQAQGLRVYAVGEQTAVQAEEQGYGRVICAAGNGHDLVRLIAREKGSGKFLHVRGADVAVPVSGMLAEQGIPSDQLVIYEAQAVEDLSACTMEAFAQGEIGAVTFFSRRTAGHFMNLVRKRGLLGALKGIKSLSLSPEVLECVQSADWGEAYAADTPDRGAMLTLLRRVCG